VNKKGINGMELKEKKKEGGGRTREYGRKDVLKVLMPVIGSMESSVSPKYKAPPIAAVLMRSVVSVCLSVCLSVCPVRALTFESSHL